MKGTPFGYCWTLILIVTPPFLYTNSQITEANDVNNVSEHKEEGVSQHSKPAMSRHEDNVYQSRSPFHGVQLNISFASTLSVNQVSLEGSTAEGEDSVQSTNDEDITVIFHNSPCTGNEIIHNVMASSNHSRTVVFRTNITVEEEMTIDYASTYCWLHITSPKTTAISVLLLKQTCVFKGSVSVSETLRRKPERKWQSCQRLINPGADYLSRGNQVFVGFSVSSAGLYTAKLNILATERNTGEGIQTRFISSRQGYMQTSGMHLHAQYLPPEPNLATFSDNVNVWSHLDVPEQHVVLVSMAIASFGWLQQAKVCEYRLELYQGQSKTVVWILCALFRLLPLPRILQERVLDVHFVSGSSRLGPPEIHLKHGCGFRLVFSFHPQPTVPVREAGNKWNCSVSHWPEFEAHFVCNLLTECAGGEDENHCPYTPCANNGVLISSTCYTLHTAVTSVTWYEADVKCREYGGRLAAMTTKELKWQWVRTLRLDLVIKGGNMVLVGVRTTESDKFLYRNAIQWTDRTTAYYNFKSNKQGNRHILFGYLYPASTGFIYTYFKVARKIKDDCSHYVCSYMCERNTKSDMHSNDLRQEKVVPTSQDVLSRNQNMIQKYQEGVNLPPSDTFLPYFPSTKCPTGHITHTFLALDGETECFHLDTYGTSECDQPLYSSSLFCRCHLKSLPDPFTCRNGIQRVPYTLVCDYIQNCMDNSDEDFCVFSPCSFQKHFRCTNGNECLPRGQECDKIPQCKDNSDEVDCSRGYRTTSRLKEVSPPFVVELQTELGFPLLTPLAETNSMQCPVTHFQCPGNKNCLPVYMRCNGLVDCMDREDEKDCESYVCTHYYRCRSSMMCVHPVDVCNGMPHCPQHDDELYCNMSCSDNCTCYGHAFTCRQPFAAENFPQLRYLDGSGSGIKLGQLTQNKLLIRLELAKCDIMNLENTTLLNLVYLDLSDNVIKVVHFGDLKHMPNLKMLSLSKNPFMMIFPAPLAATHNLAKLDMSHTKFTTLDLQILASFRSLKTLNLTSCKTKHIRKSSVQTLPKTLQAFHAQGCPIQTYPNTLFEDLTDLRYVSADEHKFCCSAMLPMVFSLDNCHAPFNEMSSCEDLLRSNIYRVPLFVLAILALLGNFVSFVMRTIASKTKSASGFSVLVLHLCLSDFLMGVYLVFIGVADRVYQGRYLWQDTSWRHSVACKLAGFVSMMSSEVSAFIICLITLDRFIVLRFPFSLMRFGFLSAQIISLAAWALGVLLALIPLLPVTSDWQFYSQTGICIPLPVTRKDFAGRRYAFGVMIILNFMLFMLVATGQAFVYVTIQSSKMSDSETSKKSQDATIARRLITIVVSDFLCWFPIGLLGLLAASGTPIPGEVNVAMAIFVLPLNSALNPFLYTLNMIQERMQKIGEDKLFEKLLLQTKHDG